MTSSVYQFKMKYDFIFDFEVPSTDLQLVTCNLNKLSASNYFSTPISVFVYFAYNTCIIHSLVWLEVNIRRANKYRRPGSGAHALHSVCAVTCKPAQFAEMSTVQAWFWEPQRTVLRRPSVISQTAARQSDPNASFRTQLFETIRPIVCLW